MNLPAPDNCAALAGDGARYLEVNAAVGGYTASVCPVAWEAVLEEIGLQSANLRMTYALSATPVPGSIEVVVESNGYRVLFTEYDPASGSGDWTWDPAANSVTFLHYVPAPRSRVEITYAL